MQFRLAVVLGVALVACRGSRSLTNTATAKLGDTVSFDDSDWVVIEAKDLGKKIKSNSEFDDEKKDTSGRFVEVHFKVTNKEKKEEMVLDHPKVIDDKGREFGPIDMEAHYVPAKTKTIGFETLQPSMPKEYWTVIEVAADSKNLKAQVHSLGILPETRNVELNL